MLAVSKETCRCEQQRWMHMLLSELEADLQEELKQPFRQALLAALNQACLKEGAQLLLCPHPWTCVFCDYFKC